MPEPVSLERGVSFGNDRPLVLIGGINVIESRELALEVAERFVSLTRALRMPSVFKASFDKANRSSGRSFRGPGLDAGLAILAEVGARFGVPVLTDIHEPAQAGPAAEVCQILQLPAFLARQTDLVAALARTRAVINVKKPQFVAPQEMRHILAKFEDAGNRRILLCERGTSFGYNNLVVDMLGVDLMKSMAPVILDVTHALQIPGGRPGGAGGRREQAAALARAGVGVGVAGLFIEAHPDPDSALCDGPSALPLAEAEGLLRQVQALDAVVKGFA
jgi:2-dehydro-3-deoxyphosphooctonate aldolase (KDO 8-P synthase)